MNPSTIIGMLIGFGVLGFAIFFTGQDAYIFINPKGLLIVLGGTLAATLISFPMREVLQVFRIFFIVLKNEKLYAEEDIKELVELSKIWFKQDMAKIENELENVKNPYLKSGIQLVIDGNPLQDIFNLLHWRISRLKMREQAEAGIFKAMASYAPAFGMLGTLIGLVEMLESMGARELDEIGFHMAVALITTFYGILLANLLFKPVSIKFERRTEQRVMLMHMVMEGISLIHQKRSPAYIRETLNSFVANYKDELHVESETDLPITEIKGPPKDEE